MGLNVFGIFIDNNKWIRDILIKDFLVFGGFCMKDKNFRIYIDFE